MSRDTKIPNPTEALKEQQQWLQTEGRKLALAHVEATEKVGRDVAALQQQVAEQVPFEPIRPLMQAQAAALLQFTEQYAGAAREALK
jgi:hypothetical protein